MAKREDYHVCWFGPNDPSDNQDTNTKSIPGPMTWEYLTDDPYFAVSQLSSKPGFGEPITIGYYVIYPIRFHEPEYSEHLQDTADPEDTNLPIRRTNINEAFFDKVIQDACKVPERFGESFISWLNCREWPMTPTTLMMLQELASDRVVDKHIQRISLHLAPESKFGVGLYRGDPSADETMQNWADVLESFSALQYLELSMRPECPNVDDSELLDKLLERLRLGTVTHLKVLAPIFDINIIADNFSCVPRLQVLQLATHAPPKENHEWYDTLDKLADLSDFRVLSYEFRTVEKNTKACVHFCYKEENSPDEDCMTLVKAIGFPTDTTVPNSGHHATKVLKWHEFYDDELDEVHESYTVIAQGDVDAAKTWLYHQEFFRYGNEFDEDGHSTAEYD